MTGMLASVTNRYEAEVVLDAGVDIIDLKNPAEGALGAVAIATAAEVVRFVDGRCLVSATIGDLPMQAEMIDRAVRAMATTGVDFIKVGVFAETLPDECLTLLKNLAEDNIKIVLVLFVDRKPGLLRFQDQFKHLPVCGVMLDTADKSSGCLTELLDHTCINKFITTARQADLITGLAGSLREAHIPALLQHQPDYLGFRGALCQSRDRVKQIESSAVVSIRKMVHGSAIVSDKIKNTV